MLETPWFRVRTSSSWLLITALSMVGGVATAVEPSNELKTDLFGALTLAGRYCERVVGVETDKANDYIVSCENGRKFRVVRSEEDRLTVSNLDRKAQPETTDHDSLVRRHLFSIINLSGNHCDHVTQWQRLSRLTYQLHCSNGAFFKVLVDPRGRVIVAKQ